MERNDAPEKIVTFSVPTRMPNEPQANEGQRNELRRLGMMASDAQLSEMGTLQAAAAIERLRQEKRQFTEDYTKQRANVEWRKYATEIAWLILIIAIILWYSNGS